MIWFLLVVGILAMGAIALVASGFGGPMLDDYDDRPDALVPTDDVLGPADLRKVRFSLAFRGYRMSEVDALLSRLADEMEWQPPAQAEEPVAPVEQAEPDPSDDVPPAQPGGLVPPG